MQDGLNILDRDGETYYFPDFLGRKESDSLFRDLLHGVEWRSEEITLFGRKLLQPRLTSFYAAPGISYTYSGLKMAATPWLPALIPVLQKIEAFTCVAFNGVLLNLYRNESDSMGWHRDNEKELGIDPVIASLSLGATRRFCLRHRHQKKHRVELALEPGSLLLMRGSTQHHWEHSLPKQTAPAQARINLTFRLLKGLNSEG